MPAVLEVVATAAERSDTGGLPELREVRLVSPRGRCPECGERWEECNCELPDRGPQRIELDIEPFEDPDSMEDEDQPYFWNRGD